jgi:hypothetical protein
MRPAWRTGGGGGAMPGGLRAVRGFEFDPARGRGYNV